MKLDIEGLWSRMRRRPAWQVTTGYLATGLAATLAVTELYGVVGLPDRTPRVFLLAVVAGLPVVIAVSWIRERKGTRPPPSTSGAPGHRGVGTDRAATPGSPSRATSESRTSILVTPFMNGSPDTRDEFIADGLTDETITDLAGVGSLRVISRSSAMTLKGSSEPFLDVARRLAVQYVLEGSVRRAGNDLRVTVRLVEVASDNAVWSQRYDGTFDDLFEIQARVAGAVAEHLKVSVGGREPGDTGARELSDPRAYESYLRARYETWRFSASGLDNAERHLRNGLAVAGEQAILYSALGQTYAWYAQLGLDPDGAHLDEARACAEKIFELDPDSPLGHWLQGLVRFQAGELRAAQAPLERALGRMPDDPNVLLMLGYLTAIRGQHRHALELFARCLDIDPLTPINHAMPGFVAVLEGRPHDSLPHYARYREMDPDGDFSNWCWAWAQLWCGRVDEAVAVVEALERTSPESIFTTLGRATVAAHVGDRDAASTAITDALRGAAERSELFSRELAHCYALLGDADQALDWLENTIRIGNVNYPFWSRHDQWLANVREEPRFRALMTQVEREWQALNPELAS